MPGVYLYVSFNKKTSLICIHRPGNLYYKYECRNIPHKAVKESVYINVKHLFVCYKSDETFIFATIDLYFSVYLIILQNRFIICS